MLERPLRLVAIVCTLVIVAGFGLFAREEMSRASEGQRAELAGFERAAPTPAGERTRERRDSRAREWVDDANDILLAPFAGVVQAGGRWSQRGVPALLGLVVYGLLLGYLARFAHGRG